MAMRSVLPENNLVFVPRHFRFPLGGGAAAAADATLSDEVLGRGAAVGSLDRSAAFVEVL